MEHIDGCALHLQGHTSTDIRMAISLRVRRERVQQRPQHMQRQPELQVRAHNPPKQPIEQYLFAIAALKY